MTRRTTGGDNQQWRRVGVRSEAKNRAAASGGEVGVESQPGRDTRTWATRSRYARRGVAVLAHSSRRTDPQLGCDNFVI
jgi:hypothetical protein